MQPREISPGLKLVLRQYCQLRNWQTVSPETIDGIRQLIERAGSYQQAQRGLEYFFNSKWVDDYIKDHRDNLTIPFLITIWEKFEIAQSEWEKPRHDPFKIPNEYALITSIG